MSTATATDSERGTFRALRHRDFRLWIIGLLLSSIGTWMQITAQDWTVLTILTDEDASSLALVIALQTVPQLLLLPVAGYVTDRFSRRRVLAVTQVWMACAAVILGVLVLTGIAQYWHVCLMAATLGIAQAFDAPARQTFVVDLLPPSGLSNGIALGGATFNLARLIGPAIAGVLIGQVGPGWIFLANGLSFSAMLIALSLMRLESARPRPRPESGLKSMLSGISYVAGHRDIRILVLLVFLVLGCVGAAMNLLVISTATTVFDVDAEAFGLLTSIMAVGSVAGALFVAGRREPKIWLLLSSITVIGLSLCVASAMPTFVAFACIMPVLGFGLISALATCNAAVQMRTDPALRGRVMGVYIAAWMAGSPVGALVFGGIVDGAGARTALAAAGGVSLVAAAGAAALFRLRREPSVDGAPAESTASSLDPREERA